MATRRAALLSIMLALWGCADGGTRGSGISTTVLGNVVSVQASAPVNLAGIAVTVEGTAVGSATNAEGEFFLSGAFDGRVGLLFELPTGGGQARIALNIPGGGWLSLRDVHLDTVTGVATAETLEVDFEGVVVATDCTRGLLTMRSALRSPDDPNEYVMLLEQSSLLDESGRPVPCANVADGRRGSVRGVAYPDGTFGEATIVLHN